MQLLDIINIILICYILYFIFTLDKYKFNYKNVISNFTKNNLAENNSVENNSAENNSVRNKLEKKAENIVYNPLVAPERIQDSNFYKNNKLNINEYTRGTPDNYTLVGLLYNSTKDKNYQLFGRRTYQGSPEWEYYCRGKDNGGLDIKFPLNTREEIYNNSTINIPVSDDTFTVIIYNFETPRYNPNIL